MPVDPQIQALLDKGTGRPATHPLPVDVARAQYEARIALMASPAEIASIREQTIEGPGGPLRIRIYTPHGEGPFPLMVFFHGSGFVLCSLDTHDGMCRNLCVEKARNTYAWFHPVHASLAAAYALKGESEQAFAALAKRESAAIIMPALVI